MRRKSACTHTGIQRIRAEITYICAQAYSLYRAYTRKHAFARWGPSRVCFEIPWPPRTRCTEFSMLHFGVSGRREIVHLLGGVQGAQIQSAKRPDSGRKSARSRAALDSAHKQNRFRTQGTQQIQGRARVRAHTAQIRQQTNQIQGAQRPDSERNAARFRPHVRAQAYSVHARK